MSFTPPCPHPAPATTPGGVLRCVCGAELRIVCGSTLRPIPDGAPLPRVEGYVGRAVLDSEARAESLAAAKAARAPKAPRLCDRCGEPTKAHGAHGGRPPRTCWNCLTPAERAARAGHWIDDHPDALRDSEAA